MGSWVTYGLGSENQDLPGFVERLSEGPLDFEGYRLVIKFTLALTEVGLILALGGLARALMLKHGRLLAVGIYLLPSSWGGGAWFGQIDVAVALLLIMEHVLANRFYPKTAEAAPSTIAGFRQEE